MRTDIRRRLAQLSKMIAEALAILTREILGRDVERATQDKVNRNLRNGRPLT